MECVERQEGCIQKTLSVIGDKWTALIIRDLAKGCQTFGSLEQSLGIGPRTLSQRIKHLTEQGVIEKDCYCEKPKRFEYRLTKRGEELVTIVQAMADWSAAEPKVPPT